MAPVRLVDGQAPPLCALNLAGGAGAGLLTALALAMAVGEAGAAYIEGVAPQARAMRVRGAEFAAAALSRDGHTVSAWGRLCVGVDAAGAAARMMPALSVLGPGDCREGAVIDLLVIGPECEASLVELLRNGSKGHDRERLIVSAGKTSSLVDFEVDLRHLDRWAVARAMLPIGPARSALSEIAQRLGAV